MKLSLFKIILLPINLLKYVAIPPIGGKNDIGSGLILVSVVIDIERIGDYTKNIYDLAVQHPACLKGGTFEEKLNHIV